jgi:hypothetical protein
VPRVVVSQFLTLDGVMQAPGDPDEDRSGAFDQGGWQLAYFDEVFGNFVMEGFAATGALLLGRLTLRISPGTCRASHPTTRWPAR